MWVKYRVRTIDTMTDDGTDFVSLGLSLPIPWGSRKSSLGGEAASLAAGDGARARLAASLDQIEAELISADASWRRAAKKAATYEVRVKCQCNSVHSQTQVFRTYTGTLL